MLLTLLAILGYALHLAPESIGGKGGMISGDQRNPQPQFPVASIPPATRHHGKQRDAPYGSVQATAVLRTSLSYIRRPLSLGTPILGVKHLRVVHLKWAALASACFIPVAKARTGLVALPKDAEANSD